ncbi:hypothetical protein SAMN05216522_11752 [Rosenbergiella nectarea]|uniref:Uncharacterized protein n=1 Tax=Rosenbergiella nectarea TaxID=988801 RepID=A0A1H9MRX9_9GAMM|nr:hypothetical protein [Rosenbergiella nectarea]SER26237.1 hypothetical protein SAMN05216522_11752 [Rosenbergiella nectarea]
MDGAIGGVGAKKIPLAGGMCHLTYITDKNGKKVYPKKSRVFPIPICGSDEI